ncbi:MAG: hypothetical protein K2H86_01940 [Muribaculaceae bacterium]|nr:hypothetical protein [Muribaculaceae bacterium]
MKRNLIALALALVTVVGAMAQNSAPAPGSGGAFTPNMGGGPGGPGGPMGGGPGGPVGPGPGWGSPWGPGYSSPSIVINPTITVPIVNTNSGITKVIACGYDAQGIWRTIPLTVSYSYNGVSYNVQVLNAWNPWTDMWNRGVDQPAYATNYFLRGNTYDYYTNLSTGTYYFNL